MIQLLQLLQYIDPDSCGIAILENGRFLFSIEPWDKQELSRYFQRGVIEISGGYAADHAASPAKTRPVLAVNVTDNDVRKDKYCEKLTVGSLMSVINLPRQYAVFCTRESTDPDAPVLGEYTRWGKTTNGGGFKDDVLAINELLNCPVINISAETAYGDAPGGGLIPTSRVAVNALATA